MKNWLNTHKNLFVPNIGTLVLVALLLGAYQVFASSPTGTLPQAGIPGFLPYQGTLTDTSGNPLNGAINMVFRFYAVPTGGTPLWEEVHQGENGVPVTQGLFHINLGSIAPIPATVWENSQLYLGVQVGNDAELSPRQPVCQKRATHGALYSFEGCRGLDNTLVNTPSWLSILLNRVGTAAEC